MGMIKRADLERFTRDACVMDLSNLEKRGQSLIDAANAKAAQILRDAKDEREKLVNAASEEGRANGKEQGFKEGFEQGQAEGFEQARQAQSQELAQLLAMWSDQLGSFECGRNELLEAARVQVIELAAAIATRVVHRVIELDPGVVTRELESVLSAITEPTRLVIRVNPQDIETVQGELPALLEQFALCEHAQVVSEPSLPRGSCTALSPSGGSLDASIPTQLKRIVDALLPNGHQPGDVLEMSEDCPEAHAEDNPQAQDDAA
jgi:flagellar assembly protein FliH